MPNYEFECPKCGENFECILPFNQYKEPQDCPKCGVIADKLVSKSHFVLKGGGWPSKEMRVKSQMRSRRHRVAQKEKDHVAPGAGMTLVPNVGGERVDSWAEAQKLAASKGKDTSSYEPVIQKEKRGEI